MAKTGVKALSTASYSNIGSKTGASGITPSASASATDTSQASLSATGMASTAPQATQAAPTTSSEVAQNAASLVEELGPPQNAAEEALYNQMLYSPAELSALGIDQSTISSYQNLAGQAGEAQQYMQETVGEPTLSHLSVLENALNIKNNVTNQPIGGSNLYAAAGLPTTGAAAFPLLQQSLAQRSQEMDDKYKMFRDQMSSASQEHVDDYNIALSNYNLAKQDLDAFNERFAQAEQYEQELNLYIQQANADAAVAALNPTYTWNTDLGAFTDQYGHVYTVEQLNGGATVPDSNGVTVLTAETASGNYGWAGNCALYARSIYPDLPVGLDTIEHRRQWVNDYGFTIAEEMPRIGDVVQTTDGDVGHTAIIRGFDSNGNMILEEANYKKGQITYGRTMTLDDSRIIGFWHPISAMGNAVMTGARDATMTSVIGQAAEQAYQSAITQYFLGNTENEGVNPNGAESTTGITQSERPVDFLMSFGLSEEEGQNIFQAINAPGITAKRDYEELVKQEGNLDLLYAYQTGNYSGFLDQEAIKYTDTINTLNGDSDDVVKVAGSLASGDIDYAKDLTETALTDFIGTAKADVYTGQKQILVDMTSLYFAYQEVKERTGLVAGNLQDLSQKLGQINDPALADLKARTEKIVQIYTKIQTGAQFSAAEMERYSGIMPNIENVGELNDVFIRDFHNSTLSILNETVKANTQLDGFSDLIFDSDQVIYGISQTGTYEDWLNATQGTTESTSIESSNDEFSQIFNQ